MVPRDDNLLVGDKQDEVSMLRTDCALYLYRPNVANEESKHEIGDPSGNIAPIVNEPKLNKKLDMKIGGMVGIGSSMARSVISLEKLRFAPGEKIKVKIEHDNSECKKPVKSFKIKLLRRIQCFPGKKSALKPVITEEEYLAQIKYEGCAEKVRENRTIEFQLPVADQNYGSTNSLHPDLRPMVKLFSESADNSLFKVEYELQIFVKHLSKLEFGMGNSVTFPIMIRAEAQHVPALEAMEGEWMTSQKLTHWQPNYIHPQVALWQTLNK